MAVANHLGMDWTLRPIDLVKGEQKSPEFASLNPNMRMPVMKDGDYVLWESNAIQQYLALRKPERGLFPSDERKRLDVILRVESRKGPVDFVVVDHAEKVPTEN